MAKNIKGMCIKEMNLFQHLIEHLKIKNHRITGEIVVVIILVVYLFLTFASASESELDTTSRTIYTIEVKGDGSAVWTTEQRIILRTDNELEAWRIYTEDFERERDRYMEEYKEGVEKSISKTSNLTKRAMRAADFEIAIYENDTLMGRYGVIRSSFVWYGFGDMREERFFIGDVFSDAFLLKGDVLTISLPEGYELVCVKPDPDDIRGNNLMLYGERSFYEGEPKMEIKKEKSAYFGLTLALSILIAVFVMGYSMVRYRRGKAKSGEEGQEAIAEYGYKSDEEITEEALKSRGGKMFQSDIVRETGFSKSKVSDLINKMEKSGKIEKMRAGRRNLIRLKK